MQALVSIHDVMPNNIVEIETILTTMTSVSRENIYLLIVPGLDWQPEQLVQLKQWQEAGYELAGHGWVHKTDRIHSLYHKWHSLFISRDVAEHLSLSSSQIAELITRNYRWFEANGFTVPEMYVPPAWAMGKISRDELKRLPYRYYEDETGILDTETNSYKRLPLAGFEADRWWRKPFLQFWNTVNRLASSQRSPLRVSIHPYDLSLRMGAVIRDWIDCMGEGRNYRELFDA